MSNATMDTLVGLVTLVALPLLCAAFQSLKGAVKRWRRARPSFEPTDGDCSCGSRDLHALLDPECPAMRHTVDRRRAARRVVCSFNAGFDRIDSSLGFRP
jgi:hypothetical protein